jgi:hypothetical protein
MMPQFDFIGRLESLLRFIGGRIDAFSKNRLHVDILSGLMAALFLSLIGLLIATASDPVNWKPVITFSLLSVACYLAPVILLHLSWIDRFSRKVPSCFTISVLGCLLLIISVTFKGVLESMLRTELSLMVALSERLWDGAGALAFLSLLTMPVTCLIHYSGAIVRAIDRWHNGSGKPVSIIAH